MKGYSLSRLVKKYNLSLHAARVNLAMVKTDWMENAEFSSITGDGKIKTFFAI